ncbi:uncharacterized protein LOC119370769 [Jatropha curcas]|uniref:uncharacterized protein LOC119370769 n=1 Tax=Jatropha curcas TaxID=180498 RepID=UPI001895758B|nr:uncharacterized protein LOC119370769 [Jatropha curcas]
MVWATTKLRHYFQSYKVIAISRMDLVIYLYGTLALLGKLARRLILLSEFDVKYTTKKTVKGLAVAEFLAAHLVEDNEQWEIDFPNEYLSLIEKKGWKLYFDDLAHSKGARKYEKPAYWVEAFDRACLFGLEALIAIKIEEVEVVGDSKLVIENANGNWKVKEDRLKPYIDYLRIIVQNFKEVTFTCTSRVNNRVLDALANLASVWEEISVMPKKPFMMSTGGIPCYEGEKIMDIEEEENLWFYDVL